MKRLTALLLALFLLPLAGCRGKEAAPVLPEISETTEEFADAASAPSRAESSIRTGLIAEQILSGAEGDIHDSFYLPESYDGSRKYPLMVVMPGYDMMCFVEESSGSNLNWVITHSKG